MKLYYFSLFSPFEFTQELELPGLKNIPSNATNKKPDSIPGKCACWNALLNAWEYIPDHRNKTVYNKKNLSSRKITELGDLPNSDETESEPLKLNEEINPFQIYNENSQSWEMDLSRIKENKLREVSSKHEIFLNIYRGSVKYNSLEFDSGEKYKKNIEFALKEIQKGKLNSDQLTWLDFHNIPRTLSGNDLQNILSEIESDLFLTAQNSYKKKWYYRDLINQETNPEILLNLEVIF